LYFALVLSIFTINAYAASEFNNTPGTWGASDGLNNNDYSHPSSLQSFIPKSYLDLPLWAQIFLIPLVLLTLTILVKIPTIIGRLNNILDNKKRQAILKYVQDNPGCTIADISDTQNINRGTVKYHIFQLQLNGKIFQKRAGKFSRLFHKTTQIRDIESVVTPYLRNETSKSILKAIMEKPGITNQELSSMFNLDKSTIHWYLQKFDTDGIIEFKQVGKFRQCAVNDEAKMVLLRFMPA
jgi:predicted transcriptional regulator